MLQPPTGYWVHYSSNYIKLNRLWCDTQEVWQDDLVVPPGLKLVNLNKQDRKKTEVKSLGKWQSTAKKSLNSQCSTPDTKPLSLWTFPGACTFSEKIFYLLLLTFTVRVWAKLHVYDNHHTSYICMCFKDMSNNSWRIKMEKEHRTSFTLDDSFQHSKLPDNLSWPSSIPAAHSLWNTRL